MSQNQPESCYHALECGCTYLRDYLPEDNVSIVCVKPCEDPNTTEVVYSETDRITENQLRKYAEKKGHRGLTNF